MQNLRINNRIPVQTDFHGNGAIYHGYAGMPDKDGRVYTDELCALEAKRAVDMKLKIARTFYGWWAWDKETDTWNWDNEIMTAFYKWLGRMKDGGVTVALNTGWCSPGDINSTHFNGKSPFTVPGDWQASCDKFGDFVSETYYQLVVKRGFTNIKIFIMFTEPQRYSGKHEKTPFECWYDATLAAHKALIRDGYRDKIKLMGPNEVAREPQMLPWVVENADELIDIYSSHHYSYFKAIDKKYCDGDKSAIAMTLAGARFCQTVDIKPNTDYEFYTTLVAEFLSDDVSGSVHIGAYIFDGRDDIHLPTGEGSGPNKSLVPNSAIDILPTEIPSENYKSFKFCFNSGNNTKCVVGVFDDIISKHNLFTNVVKLTECSNSNNVLVNGDFSDNYNGWTRHNIECYKDSYTYFEWVANNGLKHIQSGKPFCYDEYNSLYDRDYSRNDHGANICNAAVAFMNCGCQSSLLWTIFDQQWPNNHCTNDDAFVNGDHRCGVAPVLTRSLVPHKSYYAFTLISKYVTGCGGTKVYKGYGKDCLYTTMSVSPEGDITVIVVNDQGYKKDFTVSFDEPVNREVNRHLFNPETCVPDEKAKIIGTDITLNITDNFSDTIPAYGVAVYTTLED